MARVEDAIREREAKEFGKELDSKVKLEVLLGEGHLTSVHGCSDEGARLLFKFRAGMHRS